MLGRCAERVARCCSFLRSTGNKYERNAYFFSVGFVFDKAADVKPYHPVLCKLASVIETLEVESEFLFREKDKATLEGLLEDIYRELNTRGECSLVASTPRCFINYAHRSLSWLTVLAHCPDSLSRQTLRTSSR